MSILRIARVGHPVLRQVAEPVNPRDIPGEGLQRLIGDMLETLQDYGGAGLAANQVHVPLRLVVALVEEGGEPLVFINPELTWLTEEMRRCYEGCLSLPSLRCAVDRVASVRVEALDKQGKPFSRDLEGLGAVALQHEVDHLDGVLFLDQADLRTLAHTEELQRFGPLDRRGPPSGSAAETGEEPQESPSEPPGCTGTAGRSDTQPRTRGDVQRRLARVSPPRTLVMGRAPTTEN